MTRWKDLITMFCRVHFVFSFQLFISSPGTFRLQRWSSRGHILKSLASKLQVLENCLVLGSRTAVFLESLKFCRSFFVEKLGFLILFFWEYLKKNWRHYYYYFFFGEHLRLCPCPRKSLSSKRRKGCLWPRIFFCVLGLEPSTPPLSRVRLSLMLSVFRLSPISTFI